MSCARVASARHWMWYIFPQIKGLGRSATADHFAIRSLDEARAYRSIIRFSGLA